MSKLYLAVGATTGVGEVTRRGVAAVAAVVCHVQLQGGGTKLRGMLVRFFILLFNNHMIRLRFTFL